MKLKRPWQRVAAGLGILISPILVSACARPAAPAACPIGDGNRIVVLVSGTASEPRPALGPLTEAELRAAADSRDATDGPGGRGSAAIVITTDGRVLARVGLTPRRASCAVEHGQQRAALIEAGVRQVAATVSDATATRPGLDLLSGVEDAVRGNSPGLLVVDSSAVSTAGGLDLRQLGWRADPADLVAQLRAGDLLPHLRGWRVLFVHVGATAGAQPSLSQPARDTLHAYLTAICTAAGATACTFDDTPADPAPSQSTAVMPIVPVPDVQSATGPHGEVTLTLSDDPLGFAGDSALISPAGQALLHEVADRITARLGDRPDAVVTLQPYAADPPGSGPDDRRALAAARGQATADALRADGVTARIDVVTTPEGTPRGETAIQHGGFVEALAHQMRRVEITY